MKNKIVYIQMNNIKMKKYGKDYMNYIMDKMLIFMENIKIFKIMLIILENSMMVIGYLKMMNNIKCYQNNIYNLNHLIYD